jgi:pyruvate/oxaloacetate carboxyltransferase
VEKDEDYITYALFPDIAIKYFKYRENLKKLSTYTLEVIVNTRKFNFNIK